MLIYVVRFNFYCIFFPIFCSALKKSSDWLKKRLIYFFVLDNKAKVFYGIPKAPDFQTLAAPVEEEEAEVDKSKKKKAKRDPLFSKKTKSDPNAPPPDRLPFPELYVHI